MTVDEQAAPVVEIALTAHPLQRVGAFALAALAARATGTQKVHPEQLTPIQIRAANDVMTRDLEATIDVEASSEEGGFWLSVSYMLWPNCPINKPARKKKSRAERHDDLHQWRDLPAVQTPIGAHCMLCDAPGCGFFGKREIPLAQSPTYRNTTLPGHAGIALCRGCLLSFYALPYGCELSGGRASALHSWDDAFLQKSVARQVRATSKMAFLASQKITGGAYARQRHALRRLVAYDGRLSEGVELMVFTNSNREQDIAFHEMSHPLADWAAALESGELNALAQAHHTKKVPGADGVAHTLFESPSRLLGPVRAHLATRIDHSGIGERGITLAALCRSYCRKVLMVSDNDLDLLDRLSLRIAEVIAEGGSGQLKKFNVDHKKPGSLQKWLKRAALDDALHGHKPLVDTHQWRLLFDAGNQVFLHRDLVAIGVFQHLHTLQPSWLPDAADEIDPDDAFPADPDDEENNQ